MEGTDIFIIVAGSLGIICLLVGLIKWKGAWFLAAYFTLGTALVIIPFFIFNCEESRIYIKHEDICHLSYIDKDSKWIQGFGMEETLMCSDLVKIHVSYRYHDKDQALEDLRNSSVEFYKDKLGEEPL